MNCTGGMCETMLRCLPSLLLVLCLFVSSKGSCKPGDSVFLPRICVRDGILVEKESGRPFHPIGFHYIRILPSGIHYVFAPSLYDPARAERMLADLEAHRFNIVRVFIGGHELSTDAGLYPRFMANFRDFLARAGRHHVYILPVVDWIPGGKRYQGIVKSGRDDIGGMQMLFMDPAHVKAKILYLTDFISAIKQHDPRLLTNILAFELENEACMMVNEPPFSQMSGSFRYNRRSYDLASEADLQRLSDDAISRTADTLVDVIHGLDPDAMVSYSVFTFAAVGRTGPGKVRTDRSPDPRFPVRPLALVDTKLSYIDVHFYGPSPEALTRDLKSIEWDKLKPACAKAGKPLIVGEFGSIKSVIPNVSDAARLMPWYLGELRKTGFTGAIYWTYDCDEQPELWNAKSGGGVVFDALAGMVGR